MITTTPAYGEWEKEMDDAIQWPNRSMLLIPIFAMTVAFFMSIQGIWLDGAESSRQWAGIFFCFMVAMIQSHRFENKKRAAMMRLKAMVENDIEQYGQMTDELPDRIERELTEVLGEHGIMAVRAPDNPTNETLN